ncbi:hypothetical protein JCM13369A_12820 [Mediterraneibacter glycyrrhizinilyticus JCM 13369]
MEGNRKSNFPKKCTNLTRKSGENGNRNYGTVFLDKNCGRCRNVSNGYGRNCRIFEI